MSRKVRIRREEGSVKGENGRVLVVGGSDRYPNTPAIVALGALRTGVDLVRVASPGRSAGIVPGHALNIVSEPLEGGFLNAENVERVVEASEKADVLAIGSGLGRKEETVEAVREILERRDLPAVVDADAIHAVQGHRRILQEDDIVTPHAGEFEALTGGEPGEGEERREAVTEAARQTGCTVLLKGRVDLVSDGERLEENDTGNAYMTRGGTGDTLAGIASGLLSMGRNPLDSASEAAYVNGRAGELALEEKGPGFLLEEMLRKVPKTLEVG
ncbi:MAG: NAD(P)H-hydrate dehydratase [Candidatus Nanohaloarchaea archaeon]|nr:NAD(P)H-hydrate dehydratase [Candidatus Nanohaloarchaea archaeon]